MFGDSYNFKIYDKLSWQLTTVLCVSFLLLLLRLFAFNFLYNIANNKWGSPSQDSS